MDEQKPATGNDRYAPPPLWALDPSGGEGYGLSWLIAWLYLAWKNRKDPHAPPDRPSSISFFPNESREYRFARDRLLTAESDMPRSEETIQLRRVLPRGGLIPTDYRFRSAGTTGPATIALSEFFHDDISWLVIYNVHEPPCPACAASLVRLDAYLAHLNAPGFSFAIVVKTSLDELTASATARGWRHVHFYSAAGTTFKADYHSEATTGAQIPLVNVFEKASDGIRHFWTPERWLAASGFDENTRHHDPIRAIEDAMASARHRPTRSGPQARP